MRRAPLTIAIAISAAVLLIGCGVPNPNAPSSGSQGLRAPGAVVAVPRDARVRLAVAYTLTQATWTPDTYLAQRGRLAELSIANARAQLTPRNGQSTADIAAALKAADSSSTATLIGTDAPTTTNEVIVAYKTHTTGTGRHPGRPDYQIAHLTLTRHHDRWLVSRFAIQP